MKSLPLDKGQDMLGKFRKGSTPDYCQGGEILIHNRVSLKTAGFSWF